MTDALQIFKTWFQFSLVLSDFMSVCFLFRPQSKTMSMRTRVDALGHNLTQAEKTRKTVLVCASLAWEVRPTARYWRCTEMSVALDYHRTIIHSWVSIFSKNKATKSHSIWNQAINFIKQKINIFKSEENFGRFLGIFSRYLFFIWQHIAADLLKILYCDFLNWQHLLWLKEKLFLTI